MEENQNIENNAVVENKDEEISFEGIGETV